MAAAVLGGDEDNVNKWDCVGEMYPEKEGAPKSLREMEWYMLDYVGSVNVSADNSLCERERRQGVENVNCEADSMYYDKKTQGMHFYTAGADFGNFLIYLFRILYRKNFIQTSSIFVLFTLFLHI